MKVLVVFWLVIIQPRLSLLFLILVRLLVPSKYEVINNDIKEGLQNVIVGDERYSNTQVKAKIFLERLEESSNAFIHDFLQPQVKMICQNLGFRKYPTVKFEQTDIKDEVQLQRVATRLMELGIITPEQGMDVLEKGFYPKPDEMEAAQKNISSNAKRVCTILLLVVCL
jgi:hypothetical protein